MKVDVGKSILLGNDEQAAANRRRLGDLNLLTINVMASPGAGKTSVIMQLLSAMPAGLKRGVIEGDVASRIDADKIQAIGVPVTQINTGGGCHLTAKMIADAMDSLKLTGPGMLFIENIGNLICPASFDLGEAVRVVIASVAEGDDKPIKYPGMFTLADAIILNKTDLQPHVEFQMAAFERGVRAVNADAPIFHVSCRTGEGVHPLLGWLLDKTR